MYPYWPSPIPKPRSKLEMLGNDAAEKLIRDFVFKSILDVGCRHGTQTRFFQGCGKEVTSLDVDPHPEFKPDYVGFYEDTKFPDKFEAIWSSHVLEHTRDPGRFLDKVFDDLKDDGIAAITVPPSKPFLADGHMTLWTPGLLLYHMIIAGFDCRQASVKMYGYNISVIVVKKAIQDFSRGTWEFNKIAKYFPMPVSPDTDGRVMNLNWG